MFNIEKVLARLDSNTYHKGDRLIVSIRRNKLPQFWLSTILRVSKDKKLISIAFDKGDKDVIDIDTDDRVKGIWKVSKNTKKYIKPLPKGIFQKLIDENKNINKDFNIKTITDILTYQGIDYRYDKKVAIIDVGNQLTTNEVKNLLKLYYPDVHIANPYTVNIYNPNMVKGEDEHLQDIRKGRFYRICIWADEDGFIMGS